ncbi:MAG: hypothetical protein IJ544_06315 [Prevotella sp.]|nr:hypothetical protein [Prevotella sp.]
MNRLRLFMLLRRQNGLALRRSPAFEQSIMARVMLVLGAGFMVIYLIFLGTMLAMPATEDRLYGLLLAMTPMLWMPIDFGVRFGVQQTPAMFAKPYLLQPMPFGAVIENFLVNTLLTGYNFTWLALFLPYAFIVFCGGASWLEALSIVFSGMMLILANSQIYLMVRTLVARNLLWWALPIVLYGGLWVTLIIDEDLFEDQMDWISEACMAWWFPLSCLCLLAGLFCLNRWMQLRFVREEISRQEKKEAAMKHVSKFTFLERFGMTGEYLKLEVKSIMRNKAIKSRVVMSVALIVVFTLLVSYTSLYDGQAMLNFWCFYCFGIYGITAMVKVMGPEGNYIDLLLVHHESILSLLKAKYYFHTVMLLVPFILMIPAVIACKFSLLMMFAYMFICSGLLYFMLFQLAVYNKQTLPLNAKITGKNSVENGMQLVIELLAMFVPLIVVAALVLLFDETTAYWTLIVIGLLFTLTHPLWLRNVYTRMMRRKYENLEGFHASRT